MCICMHMYIYNFVHTYVWSSETRPRAPGGGYKRGTQSVVAGLTAALWDMDKAEVQDWLLLFGVPKMLVL